MNKALYLTILFASNFTHAEYYKITVEKVDKDLYRMTDGKLLIETKYCYEYAPFNTEAILKYERYSYDNKIIFESGTSCDVKEIASF